MHKRDEYAQLLATIVLNFCGNGQVHQDGHHFINFISHGLPIVSRIMLNLNKYKKQHLESL